jgi:hypothetical protein
MAASETPYTYYANKFADTFGGKEAVRDWYNEEERTESLDDWFEGMLMAWAQSKGYFNDQGWTDKGYREAGLTRETPEAEEPTEDDIDDLPDDFNPNSVTEEQIRELAGGYPVWQIKLAVKLYGAEAIQAKLKEFGYDFSIDQINEVGRTGKITDDLYDQAFPEEEAIVEEEPEPSDMDLMDAKFGDNGRPTGTDLTPEEIAAGMGMGNPNPATDIDEQPEDPGVVTYPDTKTGLEGEDEESDESIDIYNQQNPTAAEPEGEIIPAAEQDAATLEGQPVGEVEEEELGEAQGDGDFTLEEQLEELNREWEEVSQNLNGADDDAIIVISDMLDAIDEKRENIYTKIEIRDKGTVTTLNSDGTSTVVPAETTVPPRRKPAR